MCRAGRLRQDPTQGGQNYAGGPADTVVSCGGAGSSPGGCHVGVEGQLPTAEAEAACEHLGAGRGLIDPLFQQAAPVPAAGNRAHQVGGTCRVEGCCMEKLSTTKSNRLRNRCSTSGAHAQGRRKGRAGQALQQRLVSPREASMSHHTSSMCRTSSGPEQAAERMADLRSSLFLPQEPRCQLMSHRPSPLEATSTPL